MLSKQGKRLATQYFSGIIRPVTDPLLWAAMGALVLHAGLFYAKELEPG